MERWRARASRSAERSSSRRDLHAEQIPNIYAPLRVAGGPLQPQPLVHPQVHVHGLDGCAAGALAQVVQAVIEHAFSPSVHLHRIQANVRPENSRSVALLHRLGFEDEGLAREYLFINGAWCDHRMFALRNEAFTGGPVLGGPPAN